MSVLNSSPASEEESFSGPVRLVFVVIRQTSGRTFSSRLGANHPGEMVLTCADVCDNSGPSSDETLPFGPMGHASVPFRHAPGGAVSSLLGVVVWRVLQIAQEIFEFSGL